LKNKGRASLKVKNISKKTMSYTEKVKVQVKAILEPFEKKLLEEVRKLVLDSFKNGISVGKQGKAKNKEPQQEKEQEENKPE